MFADSAAFRELEARWLNRFPSLRNALLKVLNESEARCFKDYKEAQARLFDRWEGRAKSLHNEQNVFLKHLKARDKRHDKKVKELILQNCDLIVGSSLFYLSTRFLILQQDAVLEEMTKRIKLEGNYNVRGALGM